jgi:hypothetical protein|uniref:Uncharacterized protein n=1 Tax=Eutreptiella gymnastica TaxID=73025 RepID=A0A7S4CAY8_9EUGL
MARRNCQREQSGDCTLKMDHEKLFCNAHEIPGSVLLAQSRETKPHMTKRVLHNDRPQSSIGSRVLIRAELQGDHRIDHIRESTHGSVALIDADRQENAATEKSNS